MPSVRKLGACVAVMAESPTAPRRAAVATSRHLTLAGIRTHEHRGEYNEGTESEREANGPQSQGQSKKTHS